MLITESKLRRIIREEFKQQFTPKEMGIDHDPEERKALKWWQSPKKRQEFAESYTSGQNRISLISTVKSKVFKSDTPDDIIKDYYDEFILPQILYIINETWVVREPLRSKKGTRYVSPNWSEKGSQELHDPNRISKSGKIVKGTNWIAIIPGLVAGLLAGPIWGGLVGGVMLLVKAIEWRRYTFGHELSHAIDREVDLMMGIRWENGYQNPKSIYRQSTDPVENPKYLPYRNEKIKINRGSIVAHQREILRDIFPCINEDHPEYKDEHAHSPGELYSNVIQTRKNLKRKFKASDIKKWRVRGKIPVGGHSSVSDLVQIIKACGNGSNEEIATALNKLG